MAKIMKDTVADTVLVVDDNIVLRTLLFDMLHDRYVTRVAESGQQALDMIAEELPDLILLDIHMVGLDGFEVCTVLKNDTRTSSIPIIFLTADTQSTAKLKGLKLGAIDYITKPFNRHEVLARVHNQLELKRITASLLAANRTLCRQQKLIDTDLRAGAEIQKALLPSDLSAFSALDFAWFFQPCERIGGDIFNVINLGDNHIGVYIIDVCGHGVPAAMIATLVFQYLSPSCCVAQQNENMAASCCCLSPADVIRKIDREFPFERFGRYFTMSYMVLDCSTGHFRYCCAGHPPIVRLNSGGECELLGKGGAFIGMCDMVPQIEEGEGILQSGDRLFFYTDGVLEHENNKGDAFGSERLFVALSKVKGANLQDTVDHVIQDIWGFADSSYLKDDFSLLGVEFIATSA